MTTLIDGWLDLEEEANRMYSYLISADCSRTKPTNSNRIKANLSSDIITLCGLWGGSKESEEGKADEADINTIDFLYKNLSESLKHPSQSSCAGGTVYIDSDKPIYVCLLFCDAHHIIANKISLEKTQRYFSSLELIVEKLNKKIIENPRSDIPKTHFQLIKLSDILEELECFGSDNYFFYKNIDPYSKEKTEELFSKNEEFASLLTEKVKKHSLWVKEDGIDSKKIARLYTELEIFFLKKVSSYKSFRFYHVDLTNSIFFSYSDPKVQKPIAEAADVPMLFLHSSGKGHHECPWYSKKITNQ